MWETNVIGTLRVTKALLPTLRDSGDGHIITVTSIAALEPYDNGAGYTGAKHAQAMLHRTLRGELLGQPIRLTEILPGMVETDFSLVRFDGDEERAAKVYQGITPLTADDVADVISFAATRPRTSTWTRSCSSRARRRPAAARTGSESSLQRLFGPAVLVGVVGRARRRLARRRSAPRTRAGSPRPPRAVVAVGRGARRLLGQRGRPRRGAVAGDGLGGAVMPGPTPPGPSRNRAYSADMPFHCSHGSVQSEMSPSRGRQLDRRAGDLDRVAVDRGVVVGLGVGQRQVDAAVGDVRRALRASPTPGWRG